MFVNKNFKKKRMEHYKHIFTYYLVHILCVSEK